MRRVLRWLAFAAALGLAACALGPPEPPTATSLLDQLPGEVPRRARSAATLLVYPPEGRPGIDTTRMAYTLRPHHFAYFTQNQWAETPPQMLQPLLLRTLEATGAFAIVMGPPNQGTPTLALRTEVTELVQDFSEDPPVLRLALRVRVSDPAGNRVLGAREIVLREPLREKASAAGVQAANTALATALREVAAFVLEQLP